MPSYAAPQKAYVAVAEELRRRIESGDIPLGDCLPSERELTDQFQVSRSTIRHSLQLLEEDGLIVRRRGRTGETFVKTRPPKVELRTMQGFMPQLRDRGMNVYSEVLRTSLESANASQSSALGISLRAPVFRVVRLRHVDGNPLLIEDASYSAVDLPQLLDQDLSKSIYELLENRFGRVASAKQETITPAFPTNWERSLLKIGRSELILRIERVAYDQDGRSFEYAVDSTRTELARIQVTSGAFPTT